MNTKFKIINLFFATVALPATAMAGGQGGAFGHPGAPSIWSYAGKTGVGTSYEAYDNGQYRNTASTGEVSKVWFSIAQGIVTETAFGRIDQAQIKDLQFLITGPGFFDEERLHTVSQTEYLYTDDSGRPLSLAYRVTNTDAENKYIITKDIFTDPDRQTLFMRVTFRSNANGVTPYILLNPHMKNTGNQDVAYVGPDYLNAREDDNLYLSLVSSAPMLKTSAGFVGSSDGWTDLNDNGQMDWQYDWADNGGGNVALTAQLQTVNAGESVVFDIVIGFGSSHNEALTNARTSMAMGYDSVLGAYNGQGNPVGWEDYLFNLSALPNLVTYTKDNGKQLYASALVLKALEDKENAGALIASLSIPWGNTVSADNSATGYRAVWPRDFYQVAMALLALGDTETPKVAFDFLRRVQVTNNTPGNNGATGWFLQKSEVNGTPEWNQVQLDQTAMPIMLAWKLQQKGLISNSELVDRWWSMIKPAAEFLANGGSVNFDGNAYQVDPPWTRQERWEEQSGYSPGTIAAVITGLTAAADISDMVSDPLAGDWYRRRADIFEQNLDAQTYTTSGPYGDGQYYIRITNNTNPNDGQRLGDNNGRPGADERLVIDQSFLELVRYGVRSATNQRILSSLNKIDNTSIEHQFRIRYNFGNNQFPGFRRYGNDGYGERTSTGGNWLGGANDQRGRVWPIFTGERGHYELEALKNQRQNNLTQNELQMLVNTYVQGMESFANEGLMLPEQVWDGVGNNNTYNYPTGKGTNSATPLAWSHAEYVKLVRSIADQNTWDSYSIVRSRYNH